MGYKSRVSTVKGKVVGGLQRISGLQKREKERVGLKGEGCKLRGLAGPFIRN